MDNKNNEILNKIFTHIGGLKSGMNKLKEKNKRQDIKIEYLELKVSELMNAVNYIEQRERNKK